MLCLGGVRSLLPGPYCAPAFRVCFLFARVATAWASQSAVEPWVPEALVNIKVKDHRGEGVRAQQGAKHLSIQMFSNADENVSYHKAKPNPEAD